LIAVDGVSEAAVLGVARDALSAISSAQRAGVSRWDASGVFGELIMGVLLAGAPSAETLLLLYAADLAFRLRWEIRPALAEGRTVVAASYVDTAVAFGRAADLPAAWLANLFQFAQRPTKRYRAGGARRTSADRSGFIEFACEYVDDAPAGTTRAQLVGRARLHLKTPARRRVSES
jgi:hypothetical protein